MCNKEDLKRIENVIEECKIQLLSIKSGYCPECSCIEDDQYYCLTCEDIETDKNCEINSYNLMNYILEGKKCKDEFFEKINNFKVIFIDDNIDINFLINDKNKDMFVKIEGYIEFPMFILFDYINKINGE